ncbi:DMT family transporter [Candidatus Babeliales bacterium]|nr:DMT family transporter [Candidatus Babeliales bacterium]
MILIILVYAILASTFTLAKASLQYSKPFFLIGCRMILAGTFLLGYLALFKRKALYITKNDLLLFLKVALTHVYIFFIFEFWALSFPSLSSSKTSLIFTSTPFVAAFLSYLLLGERLSLTKIMGMALGIIGLAPVLVLQVDPLEAGKEFFRFSFPEAILLIAVVSGAYAWFDIKKLMSKGYSLLLINGFAMLVGGIGAFLTSSLVEGFTPFPVSNIFQFSKYVLALILVSNIVFYNFYGWLLKRYSFTLLSFAGFLTPLFAAFYGWFFLGETITWHYYFSLVVVFIALYIFYKDEILKKA